MIKLTLPYPPSTNVYWRVWRNTVVLSPEARAYKRDVRRVAYEAGLGEPLRGEYGVRLIVYRPRRSRDLTNCFKVLEDALNKIAYVDDSQCVEYHAYRREDKANPRAEVQIWSIKPAHIQEKML